MTAAAFRATYSDWKLIKGRKCIQVVFEIPLEGHDDAYQALGGMPDPTAEAWFAIARLDPATATERTVRPADHSKSPPETTPERSSSPASARAPRERRPFDELPIATQAGIICNEGAFHKFLDERFTYEWKMSRARACESNDRAADTVRAVCGVSSRADLDKTDVARGNWAALLLAYRLWERIEPSVVPA